jgi:hypothetical protein
MYRLALIALLGLLAAPASATFELSDPANEPIGEDEEDAWLTQGETVCTRYLKNRRSQNENYFAAVKWLVEYSETALPAPAPQPDLNEMTRWIDAYCLEHPDDSLATATQAYLEAWKAVE